jgi:RNA recognition motif-containing protein|tara:strand:+ start:45 stop:317 length:273 start_codon:yes stop_codon:yes gene_type:complete
MDKKVFVGSLSWNTDEKSLSEYFSKVGQVEEAVVIKDRDTGRSRGFGFVTFSEAQDAQSAVDELDGTQLDGRELKVNIARSRENSPRRSY